MFRQFRGEPRISLDQLSGYDVVHAYRLIVNEDDGYVERLHEAGVRVCFDNDDDIGADARCGTRWRRRGWPNGG